MASVVLNMIVKDEAHVIERCLDAVRPHVDSWLIVDTGSTDGTQDLIRLALAGLPGELVERPWVDFGHNRSEALDLARPRGDYSLVIDADEVLEAPDGFAWPELTEDSYLIEHRHGAFAFWVTRLFANRIPWRYVGVLHEYPEGGATGAKLPGLRIEGRFDGGRSVGLNNVQKYSRDADVLVAALQQEPDNARYQYYLARSYRDSEQWGKALLAYRRRAEMAGGFVEETFDSMLAVASLSETIGSPVEMIVHAYLMAFDYRPTRAEPLCSLARYCRGLERFALARMFAAQAMAIPRPDDILFVDESVYQWRSKDEFAIASYWTGHYADSLRASRELLEGGLLPETERERVERNVGFAQARLDEARAGGTG